MFKSINGGQLPQRATKYGAGFDVFANENMVIGAGETKVIGLGICLDLEYLHSQVDIWAGHPYRLLVNDMASDEHNNYLQKDHDKNYYHYASKMYLELHPRSSLRAKGLGGGVGIIDMDYKDEIKMVITNPMVDFSIEQYQGGGMHITKHEPYRIHKGDKIGQLILKRHEGWLLPLEYTKDEERNGGFGSTGGVV